MRVGRPMYRITLSFLRFLSRLFCFPSQYAPCLPAFRRSEKKGVRPFTSGNDLRDTSDLELEFDSEDDYEIVNLGGLRTLEDRLERALAELDVKKGELQMLDDRGKREQKELADATQKLASATEYLELLAEDMEKKKSEFTTSISRLQEENRGLVQRLQEQTNRTASLAAELAEANGISATREKDIETLRARLNGTLSTVESQSVELANIRTHLPTPDTVVDTDAIKLVGRLNSEIFQAAALLAEACSSVKTRPLPDADNHAASTRVKEMFGTKFVDLVQNVPHENNPAVLRIAFQACIVVFADWIGAAWHFQAEPSPQFFGEVYRNVWLDGTWLLFLSRSSVCISDIPFASQRNRQLQATGVLKPADKSRNFSTLTQTQSASDSLCTSPILWRMSSSAPAFTTNTSRCPRPSSVLPVTRSLRSWKWR
jgi:hypothetical protein